MVSLQPFFDLGLSHVSSAKTKRKWLQMMNLEECVCKNISKMNYWSLFHTQTLGKKYFYQKWQNFNFFHLGPGRPGAAPRPASRPAFSLFQAGLEFWEVQKSLVGEMKKVNFPKFWNRFLQIWLDQVRDKVSKV